MMKRTYVAGRVKQVGGSRAVKLGEANRVKLVEVISIHTSDYDKISSHIAGVRTKKKKGSR